MSDLKLQVLLSLKDKLLGPLKKLKTGGNSLAIALKESKEALGKLQRQQNDISSFRKTKEAAGSTATQIKVSQDRVRALAIEMAATANPTKKLTTEFNKAKREAAALKDKHGAENAELQRLRTSLNAAGVSTRNLGEHEKRLRAEKDRLTQSMEQQRQKFNALAAAKRKSIELNERYNKSIGNAAVLGGAGYAAQAVGRNVANRGAQLLTPGVDYGAQTSELQAILRVKKDDDGFKRLNEQSQAIGGSTKFSGTDAAAGQTFLARAGLSTKAIEASTPAVVNMAIANNSDLARTADIASNIASAFKIDMEVEGNMGRVADVISGTAARANVNLEEMGESLKYLAAAKELKISLEQASAMTGMLGNVGIKGSQAGTTIRAMMNRLTNPVGKGADAIDQLGLKVADAKGNMRDMPDILLDIAKATKNMGNVQRKALMQDIFGEEAGSGASELVTQMQDGGMTKLIADLRNVKGENDRMAAVMQDNVKSDLLGVKSAWEQIGIAITGTDEGAMRGMIQSISTMLRGIGTWIKENPKLAGTLAKIVGVVAILAIVGGSLAIALASIWAPLAMIRLGMGRLILAGAKTPGIFRGVATAARFMGGGALAASRHLLVLGKGVGMAGLKAMGGTMRIAASGARMLVGTIGMVSKSLIRMGIAALTNPIVLLIAAITLGAYLLYKNWDSVSAGFKIVMASIGEGIEWLKTKAGEFVDGFVAKWDEIKTYLTGLKDSFVTYGADLISGLISGITSTGAKLWETMTGIASGIKERFKNILGIHSPSRIFIGYGGDTMEGLRLGLEGASGKAISVVHRVAASIADNKPLKSAAAGVMLTAGQLVMPDSAIANALATSASFAASGASVAPSIIDARAPVKAGTKASAAAPITVMGDTITLSINAAPGMDARAIAAVVERMLADRERTKAARIRSTLGDLE